MGKRVAYDRGKKFADYQWLESLREYILVGQKMPKIEIFSRQKHNRWLYSSDQSLEESIYISSIGYELPLRETYRKARLQENL